MLYQSDEKRLIFNHRLIFFGQIRKFWQNGKEKRNAPSCLRAGLLATRRGLRHHRQHGRYQDLRFHKTHRA
jgi:hypothetical protein